jgi:hypothetical protein
MIETIKVNLTVYLKGFLTFVATTATDIMIDASLEKDEDAILAAAIDAIDYQRWDFEDHDAIFNHGKMDYIYIQPDPQSIKIEDIKEAIEEDL